MNKAQILYQDEIHDDLFNCLKRWFSTNVNNVGIEVITRDQLIELKWETTEEPQELAEMLTQAFSDIIIEIPSNNGLETTSRFFNGSQLW